MTVAEFAETNRGNCYYSFVEFLNNIGHGNAFDDGNFSAVIKSNEVEIFKDNNFVYIPITSVKEGLIKAYESYLSYVFN